jgi:dipeptidyl aminopeptidase/acylaminoacyl peptidase
MSSPGFSAYSQIFIDAGFTLVTPNVRGSDGYGRKWLDSDNGAKRLEVITDIEDCALYIKKAWARDGAAPKIGVSGGSYGGYSAMMAMTRFAGTYDAGVAEVGMSNLLSFMLNTAPYRRILRANEYGDPEKDKETLLKLSPITYVGGIKGPLLIIQGANDPRVPVGEAVQMYEAAKAKGLGAELIIYPDEGHGSAKRSNQVLSIGHTVGFFEKNLK